VAFARGGKLAVTRGIGLDQRPCLWDVAKGRLTFRLDMPADSTEDYTTIGVAVSPDGKVIAAAGRDEHVRLWPATIGKQPRVLKGHVGPVSSVAFSPDGKRVVSGGEDRTVRVWDADSGEEVIAMTGHGHRVWALAVTADGRHVVSASFDKTVRLWRMPPP
jgi:WD40 repeat protein